jgi:hypothetical protein
VTPDALFQLASMVALGGWLVLLASPWLPVFADRVSGIAIPLLLSVGYAGLILAFWTRSEGGFDSLDNVALLFQTRGLLLAGWIHYLAFDLFIGAWSVRVARREGISFPLVVPCLALTFLFGPVGLLMFSALRFSRLRTQPQAS